MLLRMKQAQGFSAQYVEFSLTPVVRATLLTILSQSILTVFFSTSVRLVENIAKQEMR